MQKTSPKIATPENMTVELSTKSEESFTFSPFFAELPETSDPSRVRRKWTRFAHAPKCYGAIINDSHNFSDYFISALVRIWN